MVGRLLGVVLFGRRCPLFARHLGRTVGIEVFVLVSCLFIAVMRNMDEKVGTGGLPWFRQHGVERQAFSSFMMLHLHASDREAPAKVHPGTGSVRLRLTKDPRSATYKKPEDVTLPAYCSGPQPPAMSPF